MSINVRPVILASAVCMAVLTVGCASTPRADEGAAPASDQRPLRMYSKADTPPPCPHDTLGPIMIEFEVPSAPGLPALATESERRARQLGANAIIDLPERVPITVARIDSDPAANPPPHSGRSAKLRRSVSGLAIRFHDEGCAVGS